MLYGSWTTNLQFLNGLTVKFRIKIVGKFIKVFKKKYYYVILSCEITTCELRGKLRVL